MKNQRLNGIYIGLLTLLVGACKVADAPPSPYESGAYVVNTGAPSGSNGSITFLGRTTNTPAVDIFKAVNGRALAGNVQDYYEVDGKGVILVDNVAAGQDKIEIVEIGTFKSIATFQSPDVENPRFIAYAGPNKAYISCWDAMGSGTNVFTKPGYILVLNLGDRTVVKKIPVLKGPERIVVIGKEAFIGSAGGERVLTVINTDTDEVVQPGMDVGVNSNPIALDQNGKLWAYTSSTNEMVRIDPISKLVELRLKVGSGVETLSSIALSADKSIFYFVNSYTDPTDNTKLKGETYRFSINDTGIQANTPFIRRAFSGLGVDPLTNYLYAAVTPSYNQPGYVLRYQSSGALIDSIQVEIAPTRFFFR